MIINLFDSFNSKIKTFQSKRLPYIIYIPPFEKNELDNLLEILNVTKEKNKYIISNFYKYGGIPSMFLKDDKDQDTKIKDNCRNYKAINGELPYNFSCSIINNNKSSTFLNLIMKNVPNDDNIIKSNKIDFISEHVKNILKDIKCIAPCDITYYIQEYRLNPSFGYAGYLYEKIISNLLKTNKFCKEVYEKVKNYPCPFEKFCIHTPETENEFNKCMDNLKENDIVFTTFNSSFPDVDGFIGDIGIQITISDSHSCSILLFRILKMLHNKILLNIQPLKRKLDDSRCTKVEDAKQFYFAIITPRKHVKLNFEKRNKSSYPSSLAKVKDDNYFQKKCDLSYKILSNNF